MTEETRPPRNTRGFTLDDPVPRRYVAFEDRHGPVATDERLVEHLRRGGRGTSRLAVALGELHAEANRHPHPDRPRPIWRWRMSWLHWFTWPRRAINDMQLDMAQAVPMLQEIRHRIIELGVNMADTAPILNKLADDLRAFGAGPFAAVLAENGRLAARNAELEGEDAAETSAADNAVAAFNEMAAPVSESPDVPVEIPPVEIPADEPPAEPTPAA